MANFKISAPGRIVLAGEHSAMYRQQFISTSLDLRTKLKFCELPDQTQRIKIYFADVNQRFNIPLEEVRSFLFQDNNDRTDKNFMFKYVKSLITFNGLWTTHEQRCSLQIFFFLLYTIADIENLNIKPFRVKVYTKIPLDAGLGSSSSFAVCLAACFLNWNKLQNNDASGFDSRFLMKVKKYAKYCEESIQDYECGWVDVDITVSTYGNTVASQFTNHTNIDMILQNMRRMRILLIASNIHQKKCDQASQMTWLKFQYPLLFNTFLNRSNILAQEMYESLKLLSINIRDANLREQRIYYKKLQV